jgi:hypothetical protein
VRKIKPREIKWVGRVVSMGEERYEHRTRGGDGSLQRKHEGEQTCELEAHTVVHNL